MGMKSIAALQGALVLFAASCLDLTVHQPVGTSFELVDGCGAGPYCVMGEVESQRGLPVAGVRCVAIGAGPDAVAVSNRSGEFAIDGLKSLPQNLRFEKDGFESQAVSFADPRSAATDDDQDSVEEGNGMRLLVTMRHLPTK